MGSSSSVSILGVFGPAIVVGEYARLGARLDLDLGDVSRISTSGAAGGSAKSRAEGCESKPDRSPVKSRTGRSSSALSLRRLLAVGGSIGNQSSPSSPGPSPSSMASSSSSMSSMLRRLTRDRSRNLVTPLERSPSTSRRAASSPSTPALMSSKLGLT